MGKKEDFSAAQMMLYGEDKNIGSQTVRVLLIDRWGDALLVTGTTVPSNSTDGYAKGCLFIDTDVATGTSGLYCNKGTKDSCVFGLVTQS